MEIKNLFLGLAAFNQQEAAPSAPSHLQWGWHSITTQISALPGWAARPRACAEPFHYPGWSVNKCLNYSCHVASVSLQKLQFTLGQTLHHVSGIEELCLGIAVFMQFPPVITQTHYRIPLPHAGRLGHSTQAARGAASIFSSSTKTLCGPGKSPCGLQLRSPLERLRSLGLN